MEIAFDVTEDDGYICGYYLVSHCRRTVFWLDPFDSQSICQGAKGATHLSHISASISQCLTANISDLIFIGHQLESEYWRHWETFPNRREVTPGMIREFRDILTHGFASEFFDFYSYVKVLY